jgi:hypothetical protein
MRSGSTPPHSSSQQHRQLHRPPFPSHQKKVPVNLSIRSVSHKPISKDNIKREEEKLSGNKKNLEILSVEQMLRKDSGRYGMRGMIVGVSPVEHVVHSTKFGCSVCMKKAKRKGEKDGSYKRIHDPP